MNGFEKHGITHLSPSSLNLWINAPAVWVAQKIFGAKGEASASMLRGIAVEDAVVEVVSKGVAATDATNKAVKRFDDRILIGDERSTKERDMIAPMVERAVAILAPLGEPEFPETGQNKIELLCNCGEFKIPVIGFLDLYYPQHGRIIDIKTTGRMPSRMSAEHQLQRCIYARAKQNHTIEFLYVTPAKAALLSDGDQAATLARVKWHVSRLEAFLRALDAEQMRAVVPVCDGSFYWGGSNALSEIYGFPP